MSDDTALSPLDGPGIESAVEDALKALAAADDLDALKSARLEHVGERSPIALANRAIGGLAPADKAVAGKLLGQAKGRLAAALAERQAELEAERDLRVTSTDSSTRTRWSRSASSSACRSASARASRPLA